MFAMLLLLSRSERPREMAPPVVGEMNTKFKDLTHFQVFKHTPQYIYPDIPNIYLESKVYCCYGLLQQIHRAN